MEGFLKLYTWGIRLNNTNQNGILMSISAKIMINIIIGIIIDMNVKFLINGKVRCRYRFILITYSNDRQYQIHMSKPNYNKAVIPSIKLLKIYYQYFNYNISIKIWIKL